MIGEIATNVRTCRCGALFVPASTGTPRIWCSPSCPFKPRRRRRARLRSKTVAIKSFTRERMRAFAASLDVEDFAALDDRPTTREQCRAEARPCPWVACKHHLYLDVNPETGSIKLNFPDLEPWDLPHTCALDVADLGGVTLEEVGLIMNLTRERIRQVEVRGLVKLKSISPSPEEIGAALFRGAPEDTAA